MKNILHKAYILVLLSAAVVIPLNGAITANPAKNVQTKMEAAANIGQQPAKPFISTPSMLDTTFSQLSAAAAQINQYVGSGPKNTSIKNGLIKSIGDNIAMLLQAGFINEQQKTELNKHITALTQASAIRQKTQAESALKAFENTIAAIKIAAAQKEASKNIAIINAEKKLIEKKEQEGKISHETAAKAQQQKNLQKNKVVNNFKTKAKLAKEESTYWGAATSYVRFYTAEEKEAATRISKEYPAKIKEVKAELKTATGEDKKDLTEKLTKLENKLYRAQLITGEKWSNTKYVLAGAAALGAGAVAYYGVPTAVSTAGASLLGYGKSAYEGVKGYFGYGEKSATSKVKKVQSAPESRFQRMKKYFGGSAKPTAEVAPAKTPQEDFEIFTKKYVENLPPEEQDLVNPVDIAVAYKKSREGLGAKAWRGAQWAAGGALGLLGMYETARQAYATTHHAGSVIGLTADEEEAAKQNAATNVVKTYINPVIKKLPTAARADAVCAIQNPDHLDILLEKYPQQKTTITQLRNAIDQMLNMPDVQEHVYQQVLKTLSTKDQASAQACVDNVGEEEEGEEEEEETEEE
jgi:hypothetical protein